jgi:biopolymer transport protein ExbD
MITEKFFDRRHKLKFDKTRLIVAIAMSFGYTIGFYSFLVCIRESFRYLTLMGDDDLLLVLSSTETYFYNFFFATIASITGLSIFAEAILKPQFNLPRYVRYSIINDFNGLLWYVNYWLFKMGVFLGIFYSFLWLQNHIDFYSDYWFLFPMISFVLFFNQWLKFRLFINIDSFKLMILSLLIVSIFSSFLAFANIIDYKSLNNSILKHSIRFNYSIELPESSELERIPQWSTTGNLYLGLDKQTNSDSAVLAIKGIQNPVSRDNLHKWIESEKEQLFADEQFSIALHIHKSIQMKYVKQLFNQLQESHIRKLWFVTQDYDRGLSFNLRTPCSDVMPDSTIWQQSCSELAKTIKDLTVLNIKLQREALYFNDKIISFSNFSDIIKKQLEKSDSEYVLSLEISNDASYKDFIFVINMLHTAVNDLKRKYALVKFNKVFDPDETLYDDPKLYDTLRKKFPLNILMLRDEEWSLIRSNPI